MATNKQLGLGKLSLLAITVICSGIGIFPFENRSLAQIVPDDTLGSEKSVVTPENINDIDSDKITGGATRRGNLFHSFQEFNVGEGRGAYFDNPAAIQNIFSRVTGNNPSEILGTMGVLGAANLYFINPNGILFGENSSLDLEGSFFATTADSILFPDGDQFSALNPEAPPLLTVDVEQPIGLEFAGENGNITHRGNLEVDTGKNLALVGGDITLDAGSIVASGGKVDLGSLAGVGIIAIDNSNFSFPDDVARGNITLTNGAIVNVTAGGGGSIAVNTNNLSMSGESQLLAGIGEDLGSVDSEAGDIGINATDEISLSEGSLIGNSVNRTGIGNAGEISIATTDLFLTDKGRIDSSPKGTGNTSKIVINAAGEISIAGNNQAQLKSGIFNRIGENATGNSGGIEIKAENLELLEGGVIDTAIAIGGEGEGGDIFIEASDSILIDGEIKDFNRSGIYSSIDQGGNGNSGGINLTTNNLSLSNGGIITATTSGEGNAGKITISDSNSISIAGNNQAQLKSGIFNRIGESATGNSGGIEIKTQNLELLEGGVIDTAIAIGGEGEGGYIFIQASDSILIDGELIGFNSSGIYSSIDQGGNGNSGGINLTTANLSLTQGGVVTSSTFGKGDAGLITINASDTISVDGESGIFSQVGRSGKGNSGGINFTTANLSLTQGGVVTSSTFGEGDAGAITINASDTISADGEDRDGFVSGIFSQVGRSGKGSSGGINVTTANLSLKRRGSMSASTFGEGDAGAIAINASDTISADGESGIFSQVAEPAIGNSAEIIIKTGFLSLNNQAEVSASSLGAGTAGNIKIDASQLNIDNGASISALTQGIGNSGTITIDAPQEIVIDNSSELTVETDDAGKPGDILIDTPNLTIGKDSQLSATATENSTNTESGGSITLNISNLDLTGKLGIFAETQGVSPAGTLNIQPYAEQTDLNIVFTDTAILSTQTLASGAGGDISLTAPESINISGDGKISTETTGSGQAGDIDIITKDLNISDLIEISASTDGLGEAGNINITVDNLNLARRARIFTDTEGSLPGGNINLDIADVLTLRSNSQIAAEAGNEQAGGNGGNINIDAPFIIAFPNENSDITANAFTGNGGRVEIASEGIFGIEFRDQETALSDITASSEFGQAGEVEIDTSAVDPTRNLDSLPQQVIESEVAQSCQERGSQTTLEFFDIGRGGLPPTPEDLVSGDEIIADWIPLDIEAANLDFSDLTQEEDSQVSSSNIFPCQDSKS